MLTDYSRVSSKKTRSKIYIQQQGDGYANQESSRQGFLNLSLIDLWGTVLHCRMFSSLPGPHPPNANSTSYPHVTTQSVSRRCKSPARNQIHWSIQWNSMQLLRMTNNNKSNHNEHLLMEHYVPGPVLSFTHNFFNPHSIPILHIRKLRHREFG